MFDYALLVDKITDGDVAQFEVLLNQITPIMFKYFYRMGATQQTAEDLTQNVAVKVWRYLKKFDAKKSKFTTWLYMMCLQAWSDDYKEQQKTKNIDDKLRIEESIKTTKQNIENKNMVRVAMNALHEKQRAILILTYYHGLTNKECATTLKTTEKAIERHLSKARKMMKERLTKKVIT